MATISDLEQPTGGNNLAARLDGGTSNDTDDDSSREIRRAMSHTRFVKIMRVIFPLASVCVVGLYSMSAFHATDWAAALPPLKIPDIFPDKLTMDNPHYNGFNDDGSSYKVRAKTAAQDFKRSGVVLLEGITGELIDPKNSKTTLLAQSGEFHMRKKRLVLMGGIEIRGADGMHAKLKNATIVTKTGIISTKEPVFVAMRHSTLSANAMMLWQKQKKVVFTGDVRAHMKQEPAGNKGAPRPAQQPVAKAGSNGMFSGSRSPVDITSDLLSVFNAENRAVFKGNVHARQDDAVIATRELEILFETDAAESTPEATPEATPVAKPNAARKPAKAGSPLGEGSGKIDRILARYPVTITRGADQRVTSRNAQFLVARQQAILEGGVVVLAGPDRRVTSDRLQISQANETIVFEGNVVVLQARNSLRGRKLFVDQKRGTLALTSPPGGGAGPGRVSATLHREPATASKVKKATPPSRAKKTGAVAFKTKPGAPIKVDADSLNVDNRAKAAVFAGRVIARQGEFKIESATLSVHYTGEIQVADPAAKKAKPGKAAAEPELKKIVARTNVTVTSQAGQSATGDWARFDVVANTVEIGGDVTLRQGKNQVHGTRATIDMETGRFLMETTAPKSGGSGGGWAWSVDSTGKKAKKTSGPPAGFNARGGRPSGVFYPFQLKKKQPEKKKQTKKTATPPPASSDTSSWSATASPAN